MIKITKSEGGCVVELVGCKTWQSVNNYAYLRDGVYLVHYENLPAMRVLHTCTITIAWGSKSYSSDYQTDSDGLLKLGLNNVLQTVDDSTEGVTITFTRTIGSDTQTISTIVFVIDGVCHTNIFNEQQNDTPTGMLLMPPSAMIQSSFATLIGCAGNSQAAHNYSFTNASTSNWRSDYAFNLNVAANTEKFTMYSGGNTVTSVVDKELASTDFERTTIGHSIVWVAYVTLPTTILPTSTNITCEYVPFGEDDSMSVTVISNDSDGLHVRLRCNSSSMLESILENYENVVPFDISYTSYSYYNEYRLQPQTCGLHYCTLRWLGLNGQYKMHTFEINDYNVATSDKVELMNAQTKFDILRNNEFSFVARIGYCTRYDLYYYSDLIGSSEVYCYLHDVDSASDVSNGIFNDYFRVSVETKELSIPNGDAKSYTFTAKINYKSYDTI